MSAYEIEQIWFPCSESILAWDDDFHALLLGDRLRMSAYRAAIQESVEPGMSVLDLGTGTGILALWALEAGAARVYGIDLSDAALTSAIDRIRRAGHGGRFHALCGLSYDIELPERVDLVLSEIMGNLADNEDFVPILADARRRFLNPSGGMLPISVDSYLVPVAAEAAHARVSAGECHGLVAESARGAEGRVRRVPHLDDALRERGLTNRFDLYYDTILPARIYLADPQRVRHFALDGTDAPTYEVSASFTVTKAGRFSGFKGYFVARLSKSVSLDISGDDIAGGTTSDSWKHAYLPLERPVDVRPGDRVLLSFSRSYPRTRDTPFRQVYRWSGAVERGPTVVGRFHQGTSAAHVALAGDLDNHA
jgi:SAM-dependent methyltransferase